METTPDNNTRNLHWGQQQEMGNDSVLKDVVIGHTLRKLTEKKSMTIDDQMRDAVAGIGRSPELTAEDIVNDIKANISPEFAKALKDPVKVGAYNANTGATTSKIVDKSELGETEQQMLDQAEQGNTELSELDKQWLAMAMKPFSEELKEKVDYIKKAVMAELGFTEESQLNPLGLRHNLARLAGHRFNYLDKFEEDIEGMDKDDMRDKLKWFNMLATLDYIVIYGFSSKVGYVEKMDPGQGETSYSGCPILTEEQRAEQLFTGKQQYYMG